MCCPRSFGVRPDERVRHERERLATPPTSHGVPHPTTSGTSAPRSLAEFDRCVKLNHCVEGNLLLGIDQVPRIDDELDRTANVSRKSAVVYVPVVITVGHGVHQLFRSIIRSTVACFHLTSEAGDVVIAMLAVPTFLPRLRPKTSARWGVDGTAWS